MSIDALGAALTGAMDAKRQREDAWQSDLETIREKGFSAFVEELQQRKIEELREKLLAQMGLDEESLAALSAEQQQTIETLISQEIQRRMAATSALNSEEFGLGQGVGGQGVGGAIEAGGLSSALLLDSSSSGTGVAMLQVLQEAEPRDSAERPR